jgi:hypothetical protein|tara:strand:+ start:253 stop:459 length:207 start_codon:yes stop_codon:yes gene_type:complete
MEKEHLLGRMEGNMLENTLKTKRRVTENSFGQTVDATEANGLMVGSMVKEPLFLLLAKRDMVSGKKES